MEKDKIGLDDALSLYDTLLTVENILLKEIKKNKPEYARLMGLSQRTIYNKLEKKSFTISEYKTLIKNLLINQYV